MIQWYFFKHIKYNLDCVCVCLCVGGFVCAQVLLDDSIINVATVASSRYVEPIKIRVDEWQRQLALFNQTLVKEFMQELHELSQIVLCVTQIQVVPNKSSLLKKAQQNKLGFTYF